VMKWCRAVVSGEEVVENGGASLRGRVEERLRIAHEQVVSRGRGERSLRSRAAQHGHCC
jgi:hypothetical protein